MSAFVTETSSTQPSALVISSKHFLNQELVFFLQRAGFDVYQWSREETAAAVQHHSSLEVFDRVFVVMLGELKEVVGDLATLLKPHLDKVTIIAPFNDGFVGERKSAEELRLHTQYLRNLDLYLVGAFFPARFFWLQDVFYPVTAQFYWENWWPKIVQSTTQEIFTNSGSVFPQAWEQTWPAIQKLLLTPPKAEMYLIRGKQIAFPALSAFLQTEIQQQGESSYQVVEQDRLKSPFPLTKIVETAGVKKEKVAQHILQQVSWIEISPRGKEMPGVVLVEQAMESAHKEPTEPKNMICPPVIPKINNRMRKYEQKMIEVAERKKLHQVRRKSGGVNADLKRSDRQLAQKHKLNTLKTVEEKALEEEITRIFGTGRVQKKVAQAKQKVHDGKYYQRKNRYRSVVLLLSAVGVGVSLGLAAIWGSFFLTKKLTAQAIVAVAQQAQREEPFSNSQLTLLSQKMDKLSQVLSFEIGVYRSVFGQENLKAEDLLSTISSEIPQAYGASERFQQRLVWLVQQLFGQQPGNSRENLDLMGTEAESAYRQFSLLQNQLETYRQQVVDPAKEALMEQFGSKIQNQRKMMAIQIQLQQALPQLLGFEGRKTYALVLQNNQELRPTGGFLQAVALLTLENGVLIDSQVFDIAELDKNFVGEVTPPPDLQANLGGEKWLLRDANWSPDFPQSAQQISWFIEKMIGKKIDGVIGINLYVLQNILAKTGPLVLPEYNETLTDKNIMDKVELHSEMKLTQSGRTEYFSTILNKLLGGLNTIPVEKISPFLSSMYDSLRTGQAMIYIAQPDKNALFTSLGWSGGITTPQCPTPFSDGPCLVDTFYQVEANTGSNKANYGLHRTIDHQVVLSNQTITHQRTITLSNTATSNAWPMGTYKAYIRFYTPANAVLQEVRMDNTIFALNSLTMKTEAGKKYFGVVVEVPIGQTKQLQLKYGEPQTTQGAFSYVFFEQKQPGTGDDTYRLSVEYPANFHPTVIAPQAEVEEQKVIFNNIRDKNLFMGLKFN